MSCLWGLRQPGWNRLWGTACLKQKKKYQVSWNYEVMLEKGKCSRYIYDSSASKIWRRWFHLLDFQTSHNANTQHPWSLVWVTFIFLEISVFFYIPNTSCLNDTTDLICRNCTMEKAARPEQQIQTATVWDQVPTAIHQVSLNSNKNMFAEGSYCPNILQVY